MAVLFPFQVDNSRGRIMVVDSPASRPYDGGGRYIGRVIYEVSTGRTLQYDGVGWVILSEPTQTHTMVISTTAGSITSLGTGYFYYRRHAGRLDWFAEIYIITNGTGGTGGAGAGVLTLTLPVDPEPIYQYVGSGRETTTSGVALSVLSSTSPVTGASSMVGVYKHDGTYPGGDGYRLAVSGSYLISRYS